MMFSICSRNTSKLQHLFPYNREFFLIRFVIYRLDQRQAKNKFLKEKFDLNVETFDLEGNVHFICQCICVKLSDLVIVVLLIDGCWLISRLVGNISGMLGT